MGEKALRSRTAHAVARTTFLATAIWLACAGSAEASDPTGHFDVLSVGVASGWAYDADQPTTYLQVDFYADGPAGQGTYLDSATANQPRPDLVGTPYENHAFVHPLAGWILDGNSHAIYAHARNVGPGQDKMLINSPKLILGDHAQIWMCRWDPWILGTSQEWEFVKHNVDVIKLYVDEVNTASITDLRNLADVCRANGIKIAIELGGLVDWRADDVNRVTGESLTAENSFADEYAKVRRLTDPVSQGGASGEVAYFDIDGPIRRCLYPFNVEQQYHTVDSATDELVQVLQLWRQHYPDLKFNLGTNFPCWGWKGEPAYFNYGYSVGPLGYGDYFPVLQMAIQKTNAGGVPLTALTTDNPYDYAIRAHSSNQQSLINGIDFMSRLRDLENYVEGQGLEFGMIYNSERAGNQSTGANQLYYNETLAFIDAHLAYGATPFRYTIQSWYYYPTQWVPETSGYTMTQLVAEVVRKLRENPNLPPPWRVMGQQGKPVAQIYASGNLEVAGSITEHGVPAATANSEFVVKGGGGVAVARIDASGNLVLGGTLYENQTSLTPPNGSFIIKNSAGQVQAYIDSVGNMYLRGKAYSSE